MSFRSEDALFIDELYSDDKRYYDEYFYSIIKNNFDYHSSVFTISIIRILEEPMSVNPLRGDRILIVQKICTRIPMKTMMTQISFTSCIYTGGSKC